MDEISCSKYFSFFDAAKNGLKELKAVWDFKYTNTHLKTALKLLSIINTINNFLISQKFSSFTRKSIKVEVKGIDPKILDFLKDTISGAKALFKIITPCFAFVGFCFDGMNVLNIMFFPDEEVETELIKIIKDNSITGYNDLIEKKLKEENRKKKNERVSYNEIAKEARKEKLDEIEKLITKKVDNNDIQELIKKNKLTNIDCSKAKEKIIKKLVENGLQEIRFEKAKKIYNYFFILLKFFKINMPFFEADTIAQDIFLERSLKFNISTLFFIFSIFDFLDYVDANGIKTISKIKLLKGIGSAFFSVLTGLSACVSMIRCFNILFVREFSYKNTKELLKEEASVIKNLALCMIGILSILALCFAKVHYIKSIIKNAITVLSTVALVVEVGSLIFRHLMFNPVIYFLKDEKVDACVKKLFKTPNALKRKIRSLFENNESVPVI